MQNKQIFFTGIHKAELIENEVRNVKENEVLTRMEYTVVSGGTERACILGMNNTSQNSPCHWAIAAWDMWKKSVPR